MHIEKLWEPFFGVTQNKSLRFTPPPEPFFCHRMKKWTTKDLQKCNHYGPLVVRPQTKKHFFVFYFKYEIRNCSIPKDVDFYFFIKLCFTNWFQFFSFLQWDQSETKGNSFFLWLYRKNECEISIFKNNFLLLLILCFHFSTCCKDDLLYVLLKFFEWLD